MKNKNDISPAEFFRWRRHPFSDAYPLSEPLLCEKERRNANAANSLFSVGKSLAITGPSGSGKSTLLQYIFSRLDSNYYRTVLIHYGGLPRNGLLRAVADYLGVETNTRSMPLLMKLQKHILDMSGNQNGLYPVIAVDDAQLLERESMMDLCSLIVSPKKKTSAASLILIGDEYLAQKMDLDLMKPIKTRLTAIFRQEPLSENESQGCYPIPAGSSRRPGRSDHARCPSSDCQALSRKSTANHECGDPSSGRCLFSTRKNGHIAIGPLLRSDRHIRVKQRHPAVKG